MSVNLSNTTPAAPAGSTLVTWQTDGAGNVTGYVTSAVELTGNAFNGTAQSANIASTALIVGPTAGVYRVAAYIIVTTVDAVSSTLPKITLSWNDADNGQAQTLDLTATQAGNLLTTFAQGDAFLSIGASANLSFSTSGYLSNTPAAMKYAIHIRIEAL